MIERFYLSRYRFTLTPQSTIFMPRTNKGNILRGAFGASLKRLVCTMNNGRTTECANCILKERCAYTLIFNPVGMNHVKRLQNTPRGYLLKPPLEGETDYTPGRPLVFDMILVGDRGGYLPYAIVTLLELGKAGIGLNRGRFHLNNIEAIKDNLSASIYDASTGTVKNISGAITGSQLLDRAKGLNQHEITLHFFTPARIKYNPTGEKGMSEIVRVPEFHHLIRRLRDRINALSVTYCGGPLDIDFKGLAERAMAVKAKKVNLEWAEIKRNKWVDMERKKVHDQSGFTGEITFEGDLSEFLPLLVLGEYVHVGEDAVFGNGWYGIV